MVEKAKYIWLDGDFIPWEEARVHILTHTLHYGLGVFEGIRAYHCHDGRTAIFRLKEHVQRLFDSAHVMQLDIPFTAARVEAACTEILRQIDFLKQIFGQDFDPTQYRMLLFGLGMVLMMRWRPRGLITRRTPSVFLKERKSIAADLVKQGHFTEGAG